MPRDVDRFVEYVQDRLGNQLRIVFEYEDDAVTDIHFLRRDLDRETFTQRARMMVDSYVAESAAIDASRDPTLSSLAGSIHVFDSALVVNLPEPDTDGGLAFSFDPGTGRAFLDFLSDCASVVYGDADHLPRLD